jgi:hypothetical protein
MDDELAGVLENLADVSPGFAKVCEGLTEIAADAEQYDRQVLKTVLYSLGGAEGLDLFTAIGLLVQDLIGRSKDIPQGTGEDLALCAKEAAYLATYEQPARTSVMEAIALLDEPEGR